MVFCVSEIDLFLEICDWLAFSCRLTIKRVFKVLGMWHVEIRSVSKILMAVSQLILKVCVGKINGFLLQ